MLKTLKLRGLCLSLVVWFLGGLAPPAIAVTLSASDSGFVTEAGGSAKGDGTVVSVAKYNYSVGFELHYGAGALFSPLAPMFRKNYFVFDLSGIVAPIAEAKLKLWTGTLESADLAEFYAIHEVTDMPAALGLASALASGTTMGEFDEIADPLVISAKTLYSKLADGPAVLASAVITHDMDDSFIEIAFTPVGVAYLNGFLGSKVVLSGLVPSATPPAFPQQPFGFTGPDIPSGDPLTPLLILTAVPEPSSAALLALGVGCVLLLVGARRKPA
jgi:hypothetical protein